MLFKQKQEGKKRHFVTCLEFLRHLELPGNTSHTKEKERKEKKERKKKGKDACNVREIFKTSYRATWK